MEPGPAREVRRFLITALQRFGEAEFLLENHYTTASVYLAGYSVECMLKALILSSEVSSRHPATLESFRGAKAHHFEWLKEELSRRKVILPP